MPRTACHLVPDLPLVAELRAHPELAGRPLAMASGPGPRAELVAISAEAAREGVRRLSPVGHARAVCAGLCVRIASPALERTTRAALLDAALSLSPRAALAPRDTGAYAGEAAVYLDASGAQSPSCSERGFAAALASRTEKLGLPGHVAIAASQRVAHVAARKLSAQGGALCIVPSGSEADFLAPLPIDILDPGDALADALTRFGVHTVRDLLALPRRALGTRLGPQVLRLVALARGEETEAPLPAPASAQIAESIDLEFAIDRLEPLLFALQGPLSRLLARLEARHLACGDLSVGLDLEGGGRDAWRVGVAAPTLDPRVLARLLRHSLEARHPEAPVLSAALQTEGRPVRTDQIDLFRPAGPAPAVLGRTLTELESLCGSGRIGAPEVADDHRPEAFGMTPFRPAGGAEPRRGDAPPDGWAARPADGRSRSPAPRASPATRALRPPVPAEVRLRRGRPESIRSAIANGRVIRLAGPWRITGAWWSRESRFAYDNFDVQTSDGTVSRLRLDQIRKTWHIDAVYD